MKGLELSRAYYEAYGESMIRNQFPEYEKYMAIGLVGEGSECLGFDDEYSKDHDFGPGFCIWLPESIYNMAGEAIAAEYARLPETFEGVRRLETMEGKGRVGVHCTGSFYRKYTGCDDLPDSDLSWLLISENNLATATNGKVFCDNLGEFTRIRNGLLGFYPRDVLLKKICARMALMSQAGQYNYPRIMKRGDYGGGALAISEFVKAAVSMVYLLNRRYMPFYKWMLRGMEELRTLREVKPMLESLLTIKDSGDTLFDKVQIIENICIQVRQELEGQGFIVNGDNFLERSCGQVMGKITNPKIKSLPVMYG